MGKYKNILLTAAGILITLSIPLSFIFGGVLESAVDSILHAKNDPRFSGGEEIARFLDPVGDDNGSGAYEYPLNGMFDSKGYLDLVRYVVHKPITHAPWSDDLDFWQLAVTLDKTANADESVYSFSHPVIHIYIDLDGKAGGSVETVDPRAEKIRFDPEHPWDIMIQLDGHHMMGKLVSFDGKIKKPVRVYFDKEKNTVYGRIILDDKIVQRVLDGRKTYHYVLIGGYDHLGQGNFLTIKKDATLRTGGGAASDLSTNVYDCLVPKGKTQKDLLSSFDEKAGDFAVVYPVEVDSKGKSGKAVRNDAEIARLTALLEQEESADRKRKHNELPGMVQKESPENTVALYFHAGEYQKAEQAADRILLSSPDNPIALAYKGSLLAMKGGKTKSVAEAMRMVNNGYILMDKAVRLASNDVEKITACIARGSVSSSVPESVFMKSVQGAEDFSEAAAISARLGGMQMQTGELYIKACICLENAGQNDKAELMCMRAKQYPLSTYTKVNLLKRGIE